MKESAWKILFRPDEWVKLILLTLPLYIANLTRIGMAVTDTIMAGKAGLTDLAAVSLGVAVIAPIMMSVGAIVTIVSPMVARLRGAGKASRVGVLLNNAKTLSFRLMLVEVVLLLAASVIFGVASSDAEMVRIARIYLYLVMLNVPASILQRVVLGCFEGYRRTWPGMVVFVVALLLNIPLNYLFVMGWGPVPAMGGAGCGLATTFVHWFIFLSLLAILYALPEHRQHARQFLCVRRKHAATLRQVFRLGLPLGIATLCEMGFFCVVMLIIAPLGKAAIGAQQIAMNISRLLFTLPLSLGVAVSIRSAYLVGAARKARFDALILIATIITLLAVTILVVLTSMGRTSIVAMYTNSAVVANTAASLLILCALYQLPDAAQAIVSGFLRGCHDTRIITWVNVACYWFVGLPLAWVFIRTDWVASHFGVAGAWISFIVTLTLAAILLSWRFWRTRKSLFPAP